MGFSHLRQKNALLCFCSSPQEERERERDGKKEKEGIKRAQSPPIPPLKILQILVRATDRLLLHGSRVKMPARSSDLLLHFALFLLGGIVVVLLRRRKRWL